MKALSYRRGLLLVPAMILLGASSGVPQEASSTGFRLEPVASGLTAPHYLTTPPGEARRFILDVSANADRADAASERVILRIDQPQLKRHGGRILFGPDGYLYAPSGLDPWCAEYVMLKSAFVTPFIEATCLPC